MGHPTAAGPVRVTRPTDLHPNLIPDYTGIHTVRFQAKNILKVNWRKRANFFRWALAIRNGEVGAELPFPVPASGHVWTREDGYSLNAL